MEAKSLIFRKKTLQKPRRAEVVASPQPESSPSVGGFQPTLPAKH